MQSFGWPIPCTGSWPACAAPFLRREQHPPEQRPNAQHPPEQRPPEQHPPALFVQDPAGCTASGGPQLTPSAAYPGAALRPCTLDEAQPFLPTVSQLLIRTPQVGAARPLAFDTRLHIAGPPNGCCAPAAPGPLIALQWTLHTPAPPAALPQLASFVSALRMANLSSIPGDQVTSESGLVGAAPPACL